MRDNWTKEELKAAVDEYMRMLDLERSGKAYSKAEANLRLQNGLLSNRSGGSIEFRMANISAVLDQQGREYIDGYKPRGNVGVKVGDQIATLIEQYDQGGSSLESRSSSKEKSEEGFECSFLDDNGQAVDATFKLEDDNGKICIVFESRGGRPLRNPDYNPGLELVFRRLGVLNAILEDVVNDSSEARVNFPDKEARRLYPERFGYPISLESVDDFNLLRKNLTKALAKNCQEPGAKGGNPTKQIRIYLSFPKRVPIEHIEKRLRSGSASPTLDSSIAHFKETFEGFKSTLGKLGKTFVSFREGYPYEQEAYKLDVRTQGLEILNRDSWTTEDVGSGRILDAVIRAIEINDNNLVTWRNRFGHRNRSHYKLLDAREVPDKKAQLEALFFDLYVGKGDEEDVFERLRSLVGNRYDCLAFLFFLKDCERFMPIAPSLFDKAFRRLGVDLITALQCSWENYCRYNETLIRVQRNLIDVGGVDGARLIDAHSFCWMLEGLSKKGALDSSRKGREKGKSKRDKGRSLSPLKRAAYRMVATAAKTAGQSGGQQVRQIKDKKVLFESPDKFREYVEALVEQQGGGCALTGIVLQFDGEETDENLLCSLDRIDSNGDYEKGNLQVVCRFINLWKQDVDDDEFRRLLMLVRSSGDDEGQ